MANGISGVAVGVTLAGAVLLYSGTKGAGISQTIRGFLSGNMPEGQPFITGSALPAGYDVGGNAGQVVSLAESQLGKPYVFGTPISKSDPSPRSFDCSGLTMWVYWNALGVSLPHFAQAQYTLLKTKRPYSQKQAGDLVYYGNPLAGIHHVAIYDGNGGVIEAPQTGIPVRVRDISNGDFSDVVSQVTVCPASKVPADTPSATAAEGNSSVSGNRAIGAMMAASYGWVGNQWSALDKLWTRESNWSNTARNPSSGAYGIAQALPETKYPSAGQAAYGSSPSAQIQWGLSYIRSRYGNPVNAWAHELSAGWY